MTRLPFVPSIIFDMDGVISDTQVLHSESEVKALAQVDLAYSADDLALQYSGVPDRVMFAEILDRHGKSREHLAALEDLKWRFVRESLAEGIPLVPGIERLLLSLRANRYRLAVASGSPLTFIQQVIDHPSLRGVFEVAVSSDEVSQGKPAPDVFIEAAIRLGVSPHQCVVIEDGHSGMVAARKAGMRCIGLVRDTRKGWPADHTVSSLHDITPSTIESLFSP